MKPWLAITKNIFVTINEDNSIASVDGRCPTAMHTKEKRSALEV
jgi:DNA gyrase/topoisomerase IV subunit B